MQGTESCPEGEEWSLILWVRSLTGFIPSNGNEPNRWTHYLDDNSDFLTQTIRSHSIDASDNNARPESFQHSSGLEIKPWMDFFAYWQAYQLAELLEVVSEKYYITPDFEKRLAMAADSQLRQVDAKVHAIKQRWEKRRPTFEWLSRFRTMLAMGFNQDWSTIIEAVKLSAEQQRISLEKIANELRDTLLVMWQVWSRNKDLMRGYQKLAELLRQDIEYALCFWEILSGQRADFLDLRWTYRDRNPQQWAQLIDALPKDTELSRKQFSEFALMYLDEHASATPTGFPIDAKCLDALLSRSWNTSRALRRFCVAFFRLHQELNSKGYTSDEKVIRSNEVIEQFIITILSAEKLLLAMYRKNNQNPNGNYPETSKVVKNQLNLVLGKFKLAKNGTGSKAMAKFKNLLKEKGGLKNLRSSAGMRSTLIHKIFSLLQSMRPSILLIRWQAQRNAGLLIDTKSELHDLDIRLQIFVETTEINSGSREADYFSAAYVNFLISRNYAAHHDSLDDDFIIPKRIDISKHLGNVALKSTLTVVISSLQTLR